LEDVNKALFSAKKYIGLKKKFGLDKLGYFLFIFLATRNSPACVFEIYNIATC